MCADCLLYDHAIIGVTDNAGMEEIHQVCNYNDILPAIEKLALTKYYEIFH